MAAGQFSFKLEPLGFGEWCDEAQELWGDFLEAAFELQRRRNGHSVVDRQRFEAKVVWEIAHSSLRFSRYATDFVDYVAQRYQVKIDCTWSTGVPAGGSWIWCRQPADYLICAKCADPAQLAPLDYFRRTRILLHETAHVIDPFAMEIRTQAPFPGWFPPAPITAEIRAWWFAFSIIKLIKGAYAFYHRDDQGGISTDNTAQLFI